MRDVLVTYDAHGRRVMALDLRSLTLRQGEIVSIVGSSGCGKSTLLDVLAGLVQPSGGTIRFHSEAPLAGEQPPWTYMQQNDDLLPWRTILANVTLRAQNGGRPDAAMVERARALLNSFELRDCEVRWPKELSGGMRQRVMFARSVLMRTQILLLDEPFSRCDALMRAHLQRWLQTHWREVAECVLLVTHDIDEALRLGDRVLVMSGPPGQIIAECEGGAGRSPADVDVAHRRLLTALTDMRRTAWSIE